MKYIVAEQELEVPEDVKISVKSRAIEVKGKHGTLKKAFRHIPLEIRHEKNKLHFRMWLQKKKRNALLNTVKSTIRNMIQGVSVGYKFRMVLAYSHFPIVANVIDNGKVPHPPLRPSKSKTSLVSRSTSASMPLKASP